jgi:hypothetical protein
LQQAVSVAKLGDKAVNQEQIDKITEKYKQLVDATYNVSFDEQ